MSLKEQLEKLKQAYVDADLDNAKQLQPPVTAALLRDIEKRIGTKFPPELREIYLIHGGQRYVRPGNTGVFGPFRLFPITIIERNYLAFTQKYVKEPVPKTPKTGQKGVFHPSLIPFAGTDGDENLCIDTTKGQVWEFDPQHGVSPDVRFSSIEALTRHFLHKVKSGKKAEIQ